MALMNMPMLDYNKRFEDMSKSAIDAIEDIFPVEGKVHTLKAMKIWVEKPSDSDNYSAQKEVKLKGGTWAAPVYAHLVLIDNETRKKIGEQKKKKILNLPLITSRHSYVIGGNEYQTINQLRLKAGTYNLRKANDALETQFNLAKGANFKVKYNDETGVFQIGLGTSNVYLYPVLRDLGISHSLLETKWGSEVADHNRTKSSSVSDGETAKLVSRFTREEYPTRKETTEALQAYFKETDKGGTSVDEMDLLKASVDLIQISKGEAKPDDRDSLTSKTVHAIEDFAKERFSKSKMQIENAIKRNIDKRDTIAEIIGLDAFTKPIETLFTNTSLAATTEQINPMDMVSRALDVTLMGEGGLQDANMVTASTRGLHASHLGFLDPIMTPEGGKVGITLQMALGASKSGNEFLTLVIDLEEKPPKVTRISPAEFKKNYVIFADEYTVKNKKIVYKRKKVRAMYDGKVVRINPSKARYMLTSPKAMLGVVSNLTPFVNTNNGARIEMLDKHVGQAVSLTDRDEPLVQSVISDLIPTSISKLVGHAINTKTDVAGTVFSVKPGEIVIKDSDGKNHKKSIYNYFPLNGKSYLHDTPVVKVGDKVKVDQEIAENNYSRNGSLALGKNLNVAIIPFLGHSFEDAGVISESAAKKLTSEHIHKETLMIGEASVLSKRKFMAYFPGEMDTTQANKLDDDGVIKRGTVIKDGDYIAVSLVKNDVNSQQRLKRISRSLVKEYRSNSMTWGYEFDGIVTDVVKTSKKVVVFIRTQEPMTIADKFSGIHGNKGTVGLILPDNEMPKTKDGRPIDIMLNPTTIPSRMNPGQKYEMVAGKIAEKIKKTYLISNMDVENVYEKVVGDAKKHGVSDGETIIDPETGLELKDISVGVQHIIKLNHPTRKKFQARSIGSGYTKENSPGRGGKNSGQSMDTMSVHALLSHGAKNILVDTHNVKSSKNDDYWRAVQTGQSIPAPKVPFIYEKFVGMLNGAGVNVKKEGNHVQLLPLTDKEILKNSNGEITTMGMIRGKDNAEQKGGLFDPAITGGLEGTKGGHIVLAEEIPNPVFENAIKAIIRLGGGEYIKKTQFDNIVNGEMYIDKNNEITDDPDKGTTGGKAVKKLLSKIDVKARIKELQKNLIPKAKTSKLDRYNKELKYLLALERLDKKPTDYTIKNVPVIPPVYRPIYELPDGSTTSSALNYLYKDVKAVSDHLGNSKALDEQKKNLRKDMYQGVKALFGYGDSLTNVDLKGIVREIKGDAPKTGLFQAKLVKRRQDLSGRSVISPDPHMPTDSVGIPKKMGWEIYKPFVIRKLVQIGYTPLKAKDMIIAQDPIALKMLQKEMEERPVILNRAPTLHKFGIMAFKPRLVNGRAIKFPSLPVAGFNADFDGDSMINKVLTFMNNSTMLEIEAKYGNDYIKERIMSARFKTALPTLNEAGEIVHFDLEDFPHTDVLIGKKEGKNGPIEFYEAFEGTKVLAYNDKENKTEWADVSGWSIHKDRLIEIVSLKSKRQIITDDDPRAVYGVEMGSLEFKRNTPTDALAAKMFIPMNSRLNDQVGGRTRKQDFEKGYIYGSMAANGWVEHTHNILTGNFFLSIEEANVGMKFMESVKKVYDPKHKELHYKRSQGGKNAWGESTKWGYLDFDAADDILENIGRGARNKHLPLGFVGRSATFKKGLFAGLMDNDGGVGVSHGKNAIQLIVNYSSVSLRLIREVQLLAKYLGIKSRITTSKTPQGAPFWMLSLSSIDIKKWDAEGMVNEIKVRKIKGTPVNANSAVASKYDIVPISFDLAKAVTKAIGIPRMASKDRRSLYTIFAKAKKCGSLGRIAANNLGKWVPEEVCVTLPGWDAWWRIVKDTDTSWDQVVSIEKTNIRETGYDLTVPGYETFMSIDGIILSNTMAVHVPVSTSAVKEAWKMMPSNHLLNPATKNLMLVPAMEAVVGLNLLTKNGKRSKLEFGDLAAARKAVKDGRITANSGIKIGRRLTTFGREMVNAILPQELRSTTRIMTKGELKKILKVVVVKHKQDYSKIADGLKDLGNKHSYYAGFTLKLEDLEPITKDRDRIINKAIAAVEKLTQDKKLTPKALSKKKIEIYSKAQKDIENALDKKYMGSDNAFYVMSESGAKGGMSQLRSILASPMLKSTTDGTLIDTPVVKSYAEGLSASDMWIDSYGSRKGIVDKTNETALPGAMGKMIAGSTIDYIISVEDCHTMKGVDVSVDDKDLVDRFSAETVAGVVNRNEPITSRVISKLKRKKKKIIKVRSSLTCEASKGVCKFCAGLDENGHSYKIGDNVGIMASQAVSEPMIQMMMRCSAGLISTKDGIFPMSVYFDRSSEKTIDGEYENAVPSCNVIDKSGEVKTTIVQRHKPHDDMYLIKTRSGACMLVQGNHPMWVHDGQICKGKSNRNTRLMGDGTYRCTMIAKRNFEYDSGACIEKVASSVTNEDAIWVDYTGLKGGHVVPEINPYVAGFFAAEGCFRVGNGTKKYEGVKVASIFSCFDNVEWFKGNIIGPALGVAHNKGQQAYTVYGIDFAQKLSDVIGYSSNVHKAHNKVLKIDVASLSPIWAQQFLEAYIDGDGCTRVQNGATIAKTTSVSWELTCQIVAICHKLGLHPSVGTADGCLSRKYRRTAFDIEIRFPKGYKPMKNLKLKKVLPMKFEQSAVRGYDSVKIVKKLTGWEGLVYDVKTETKGFMAGFIRQHNTFHTGGGTEGGIINAFDRLNQIATMPEHLPGKATLSTTDGTVKRISKSPFGGWDVFVGKEKHHVSTVSNVSVKVGDKISKGDALSGGPIKPQELLEFKGMTAVRDYLTDEVHGIYEGDIRRPVIEHIIKAITSLTKISNPGKSGYIAGDITSFNKVEALNKTLGKNDKAFHEPTLKGVLTLPVSVTSHKDADWMGMMGYRYLKKTISEAASQGWKSDIHGTHPVPGLVYSAEFGQGKPGKY